MAGITGQGTTFNLPNYVGPLFKVSPTDTPFLSAIGGLTGGREADAALFQWQGFDLRAPDKARQRVEGANAQTAEARVRFNVNNVVEIHQETVEISYTKLAATGQYASTGSAHTGMVGVNGTNPVLDEMDWQTRQALVQIARDVEYTFLAGTFANPATNASARQTRGLLAATTTNASDRGTLVGNGACSMATNGTITEASHGLVVGDAVVARNIAGGAIGVLADEQLYYVLTAPDANTFTIGTATAVNGGTTITLGSTGTIDFYKAAQLTEAMVIDMMQRVFDQGGIMEQETATLIANSTLRRRLTDIFITGKNYQEFSRNVGGVSLTTFQTDFGVCNIMLNRYMPSGALSICSLEQCAPRFLPIPDKGHLFVEPLATVGAANRAQIYGEIGLEYGNEKAHGKILGVKA